LSALEGIELAKGDDRAAAVLRIRLDELLRAGVRAGYMAGENGCHISISDLIVTDPDVTPCLLKTSLKAFVGKWSIVAMEAWDQEYIDMEVPGHFTFKKDGTGNFQFGMVQGEMDCRLENTCERHGSNFPGKGKRSWTRRAAADGPRSRMKN